MRFELEKKEREDLKKFQLEKQQEKGITYQIKFKNKKKEIKIRSTNKFYKKNPEKDRFYLSIPWRKLRYDVLKENDGSCMLCKTRTTKLHVDHIKPRFYYPELELIKSNLQVLCIDCNIGKGCRDETDWRPKNGVVTG